MFAADGRRVRAVELEETIGARSAAKVVAMKERV
jgi:hypothetical protein